MCNKDETYLILFYMLLFFLHTHYPHLEQNKNKNSQKERLSAYSISLEVEQVSQ